MLKYQPVPLLENAMKTGDAVQSRDKRQGVLVEHQDALITAMSFRPEAWLVEWSDGDRQTLDLLYYTWGGRLDGLIEVQ